MSDLWGVRALREYRRRVQIIFQDPYETLNPKQTIHDFVEEPLVVDHLGRVVQGARGAGPPGARVGRPAARREYAFRFPHELRAASDSAW